MGHHKRVISRKEEVCTEIKKHQCVSGSFSKLQELREIQEKCAI